MPRPFGARWNIACARPSGASRRLPPPRGRLTTLAPPSWRQSVAGRRRQTQRHGPYRRRPRRRYAHACQKRGIPAALPFREGAPAAYTSRPPEDLAGRPEVCRSHGRHSPERNGVRAMCHASIRRRRLAAMAVTAARLLGASSNPWFRPMSSRLTFTSGLQASVYCVSAALRHPWLRLLLQPAQGHQQPLPSRCMATAKNFVLPVVSGQARPGALDLGGRRSRPGRGRGGQRALRLRPRGRPAACRAMGAAGAVHASQGA